MATPKYLIQERKGQRPHVYIWTPVLAKKKDMRPITIKEANKYLEDPTYRGQDEYADFVEDDGVDVAQDEEGYISDEDEDNAIFDDLTAEKGSPLAEGEGKPLEVTQDDLLKEEVTQINRFKKKASIEEYMLRKYEIPMLQMEGLDEMKQQAHSTLATLASSNSLYKK